MTEKATVTPLQTAPSPLSPPGPLCQWVAGVVAGRIGEGHYREGERLLESQLAAEFGVSRAPVREALRMLAGEGLVTIFPRRGAVVASFTTKMVDEVYQCRAYLFALAVRLAVPVLTEQDMARLRELLDLMKTAVDSGADQEYSRLSREFHNHIFVRTGNSVLSDLHQALGRRVAHQRMVSLSLPNRSRDALESHQRMMRAITARDAEGAARIGEEIIDAGRQVLHRYLQSRSPDGARGASQTLSSDAEPRPGGPARGTMAQPTAGG